MPHPLEYVVKDALMICDKGAMPAPFSPTSNVNVKMSGLLVTTKSDKIPLVNIPCFGACAMTGGQACAPVPVEWVDTFKVRVHNSDTLLYKSSLPCSLGGKVTFLTTGQVPLPPEDYDSLMEEYGEDPGEEEGWGWWDTAELIPVVGNIIGMVREGKKGNWGMVALNAAFLVVDVFTLGTGSVVTAPLKGGIKAGIKIAAKKSAQKVAQTAAKLGTKAGAKQVAKGAAKAFGKAVAKKVDDIAKSTGKFCVFACFPAGTKIAINEGSKNIEDIRVGDKVWAFNEESGDLSLKTVVNTMQRQVDATVKVTLANEVIETTAEHPFWTQTGWKDAADLTKKDKLRTKQGHWHFVKRVDFAYAPTEVFNFEVEDWHTYFVGLWEWLVHNAEPCVSKAAKKVLELSRKEFPNHTKMLDNAVESGHSLKGLKKGSGTKSARKNRYQAQKEIRKKKGSPKKDHDYDEFPYASTQQGGKGSHVEEVLSKENQAAGRKLGGFYKKNKMKAGDEFDIKIVD